ncbi:MAG: serine/threonine protein kinase [Sandaracinaceae bacterium]|nr:serine/threonine protein kinase [Sandaracinaceae bacterium]
MSDSFSLPVGTPIGQRFIVDTPVGSGAQGEVYRAEDRNVRGHRVAIKIMRHPARTEEQRAAAMRELELLSAVHHPSVLHFLDYGWHEGRLWFAMPWLEGETLEEVVLTRQEAKPVFEKLAAGLSALHAVGIRHQDLKPANVFLSKVTGYDELQPQLLDLGVAVRSGELMAAGSLAYFAPEIAGSWPMANPLADGKADVFALALTLREVLEPGTMPELPQDQSQVEAFLKTRAEQPVPPPKARSLRYLRKHFARWLSIDPALRPSADEFRRELDVLLLPERQRRRALWLTLVLGLVGAVATWGIFQLTKARQFETESVELSGQVAEAGERITDLEENVVAQESRVAELDEEAAEAKRRAAAAADEAAAALAAAEEAQRRGSQSASAAANARRLRAEAEAAAERAQAAQERSVQQANAAVRAAEAAARERDAADAARRRAELEAQSASSARDSAAQQRDAARAAQQRAEARVSQLESQLAALQSDNAGLERRAAQAEARATALQAEVAEARADLAAARAELTSAQASIARLEAQLRRASAGGGGGEGGGGPTVTPAP